MAFTPGRLILVGVLLSMHFYSFDFKVRPKSNTISIDSVRTDVVDRQLRCIAWKIHVSPSRKRESNERRGKLSGNRFVLTAIGIDELTK